MYKGRIFNPKRHQTYMQYAISERSLFFFDKLEITKSAKQKEINQVTFVMSDVRYFWRLCSYQQIKNPITNS